MALGQYALTTWPHLKAHLRIEVGDILLMEQLIDAASQRLDGRCRKPLRQREFTEAHSGGQGLCRGGAKRIWLNHRPIVSVTSIRDDQGTPATVEATDYTILRNEGALEHHAHWPEPLYRWNITFIAGFFATVDAVDEVMRAACHRLVEHLYNAVTNGEAARSTQLGQSVTYQQLLTGDLPANVEMLLGPPYVGAEI